MKFNGRTQQSETCATSIANRFLELLELSNLLQMTHFHLTIVSFEARSGFIEFESGIIG